MIWSQTGGHSHRGPQTNNYDPDGRKMIIQHLQSKMQRQIFIMMTVIDWLHSTNDDNYFFDVKFFAIKKIHSNLILRCVLDNWKILPNKK